MKIKLENLTKIFTNNKTEVRAVDNVSLEIPDGKLIGLLGPSGCGKSTTLYMISGLMYPTSGAIYFGEDDITNIPPEKRGIGLVFQNYALYPHMTVRQNIMYPLTNQKISKEEAVEKVAWAASLVQLEEQLDRKPNQLSGGQQQRVAIARALVRNPNVLLLDEPLSNLDARLRLKTREEIKRIQQDTKVTTIFVTHDQEEAMSISDIIVVMKDGMIQQVDEPQTIYDNPINLFVAKFLGTPPINVFDGKIRSGKLYIGNEYIQDIKSTDKDVIIGIRPEGFVISNEGKLSCKIKQIEIMGRDLTIISEHSANLGDNIRSIIDADVQFKKEGFIRFNIKPNKLFVFDKETEMRIL